MITILLRDIHLCLAYLKNNENIKQLMLAEGVNEETAVRLDYERNWKPITALFRDEVRCMASLYLYLLGKFETQSTKKLIVNCINKDRENLPLLHTDRDGFTEVYVQLDIDHYFTLSKLEKKKIILQKINEGINIAAEEYSWVKGIFENITNEIIRRNYVNEYIWKKKASPNRRYQAEVFCQHDIDSYKISMNIRDRKSNELITSQLLIDERPHELMFVDYLGDLKWESNNEVYLIHKYRKKKKWGLVWGDNKFPCCCASNFFPCLLKITIINQTA